MSDDGHGDDRDHGRDGTAPRRPPRPPRVLRLPRFVVDEEIGAGDAIARITSAVGVRPCGGCLRRAAALNHRMVLRPRAGRGRAGNDR